MQATAIIDALTRALPGDAARFEASESRDGMPTIFVAREHLVAASRTLRDDPSLRFAFLADITAVDYHPRDPRFELIYMLVCIGVSGFGDTPKRLRMKVRIPGNDPVAPTVSEIWAAANWAEREIFDLFGLQFSGHPDLRRILMPDDWEGFPLRKDYPVQIKDPVKTYEPLQCPRNSSWPTCRRRAAARSRNRGRRSTVLNTDLERQGSAVTGPELRSETMTVNMGPQHPSTHGVLRLVLELSGETVVSADTTIGFLHTGIEKTAEQKKWQQVIPLVERMDYLGAQSSSLAFCLSVEKMLGVEMPARVRDIRVLIAELQRIMSHLVWLGTHGLEIGAVSVMMYCFREREQLLNINEMLAGFRMFPSYLRIGGLREDLPSGFHQAVKTFLDKFPEKLNEYEDLLTKNQIWLKRTRGVGVVSKEDTMSYGLVGPMARAAGIAYDVRKVFPYLGYETYNFEVPVGSAADVYDRYLVRMEEMRQSTKIAHQALARITPKGVYDIQDYRIVPPPKDKVYSEMEGLIQHFLIYSQGFTVPPGEAYVPVEGPRGEHGFTIVSDGTNRPYRIKLRAPSFYACQALPKMIVGGLIADVIAVIGSTDVVMGDVDR